MFHLQVQCPAANLEFLLLLVDDILYDIDSRVEVGQEQDEGQPGLQGHQVLVVYVGWVGHAAHANGHGGFSTGDVLSQGHIHGMLK